MRKIPLTQGKFALVDDEDFDALNRRKWCAHKNWYTFYAVCFSPNVNGKRSMIYMHRQILKTQDGCLTDHINGNGLDNRKENLRVATHAENIRNRRKQINNTSGYKGVSWYAQTKKWRAQLKYNGKKIHLGYFSNKDLAYEAYCVSTKDYYGQFARV